MPGVTDTTTSWWDARDVRSCARLTVRKRYAPAATRAVPAPIATTPVVRREAAASQRSLATGYRVAACASLRAEYAATTKPPPTTIAAAPMPEAVSPHGSCHHFGGGGGGGGGSRGGSTTTTS